MKYLIILCLFLFPYILLSKPQAKLFLTGGYGNYNMEELQKANSQALEYAHFPVKLVENFPSWYYPKINFAFLFNKIEAGVTVSFLTTGSRLSYADYSGSYYLDIISSAILTGLYFAPYDIEISLVHIQPFIECGFISSDYTVKEELTIVGVDESSKKYDAFSKRNYFFEPGLRINYQMGRYQAGVSGSYMIKSEDDFWDGFRSGLTLGIIF